MKIRTFTGKGADPHDWHDPANWRDGVPDVGDEVVFAEGARVMLPHTVRIGTLLTDGYAERCRWIVLAEHDDRYRYFGSAAGGAQTFSLPPERPRPFEPPMTLEEGLQQPDAHGDVLSPEVAAEAAKLIRDKLPSLGPPATFDRDCGFSTHGFDPKESP